MPAKQTSSFDVVGIGLGSLLLVVMLQVIMLGKRLSYRVLQWKPRPGAIRKRHSNWLPLKSPAQPPRAAIPPSGAVIKPT
jgi:hypothetical protein